MAGLTSTLELEATTYGRRLVDRVSQGVLPLSDLEARLVRQWNGASTAVELSAQLFAQGVDVEAAQVAAFFRRLARVGLLSMPPPGEAGLVPPSPGVEGLDEVVPRFRSDLLVDPAPEARGVFQVTDQLTSRTFTLYDFELSVARMLDGRRLARELVAGAEAIGVTVALPTLQAFLQQLKAWRFLETIPALTATTWQPRRPWTDEVRELYQQALRLARRGQTSEALSCLESVLEVDPDNEEAPALLARLTASRAGQQALGASFEVLHGGSGVTASSPALKPDYALAQGDPFDAFEQVTDPAMRAARRATAGPALWPVAEPVTPPPSMALTLEAEDEDLEVVRPRRRVPVALLAVAAVLGGLALGLFFPVPVSQEVKCTLESTELARVTAPHEGPVTFQAASGLPVKVGEALATMPAPRDRRVAPALQARLQGLVAQRPSLAEESAGKVQPARRALTVAQAAAEPLVKQRARLEGQKGAAARKKLAAIEKQLRSRLAAVDRARAAVEAVTHAEARAALEAAIVKAQQGLQAAAGPGQAVTLVAPVEGVVVLVGGQAGEVAAGAVVARVVAPALQVRLGDGAPVEGPVEVSVGGVTQRATEVSPGQWAVEGGPAMAGKPCAATIQAGRRPFVLTLL